MRATGVGYVLFAISFASGGGRVRCGGHARRRRVGTRALGEAAGGIVFSGGCNQRECRVTHMRPSTRVARIAVALIALLRARLITFR